MSRRGISCETFSIICLARILRVDCVRNRSRRRLSDRSAILSSRLGCRCERQRGDYRRDCYGFRRRRSNARLPVRSGESPLYLRRGPNGHVCHYRLSKRRFGDKRGHRRSRRMSRRLSVHHHHPWQLTRFLSADGRFSRPYSFFCRVFGTSAKQRTRPRIHLLAETKAFFSILRGPCVKATFCIATFATSMARSQPSFI